jgi:hypothetical protein
VEHDIMSEAVLNPEFFSLASQLYVRMRRYGRVVDAVYMAKNQDYAREILQLAVREADVEILKIVLRFETLLEQEYPSKVSEKVDVPAAVVEPKVEKVEKEDIFSMTLRPFKKMAAKQPTSPELPALSVVAEHTEEMEEKVAHHYMGALR